jgi:hypothetical protein
MTVLEKFDALAQSLKSDGMGVRLTIEAGTDGAVALSGNLQIIGNPVEKPEAGYGVEDGCQDV